MAAAQKPVNLALQGGGAHGAYTWGVLDRILEDGRIRIDSISGTSAGAMNAAILTSGYAEGGPDRAREALRLFWKDVSEAALFSPLSKNPINRMLTGWNLDLLPSYQLFDLMSRLFSPYDLNPMNVNPLRYILEKHLNQDALKSCSVIKVFITATHVESGQPRVFECHEITPDAVCASACIPFLFQAVEIDGEHYWDGGYMGNPAIWPIIYHAGCQDVLLVEINPIYRDGVPTRASEIINRLNEITFNSSLIAEMRAINFVKRLVKEGTLDSPAYRDMHIHMIRPTKELEQLNASSKMNAGWDFLQYLHKQGYEAAGKWLGKHYSDIGKHSTVNIKQYFLSGPHGKKATALEQETGN